MARHRYLKEPKPVKVDKDLLEQLKKLRQHRGEPLGEVVRRLVKEHLTRVREVVGY